VIQRGKDSLHTTQALDWVRTGKNSRSELHNGSYQSINQSINHNFK